MCIAVGDEVWITDQTPRIEGVVVEVSTWEQIGGIGPDTCYLVRCDEDGWTLWIGDVFVKPREAPVRAD